MCSADAYAKTHYYQSMAQPESEVNNNEKEATFRKPPENKGIWDSLRRWSRKLINKID